MANLQAFFFGSPTILFNRNRLDFDTRKAVALFCYLTITRKQHQRDTLSTIFWPEQDQSSARGSLRRTLSSLKKELPDGTLEITREYIGIRADINYRCDYLDFQNLLDNWKNHKHLTLEACLVCKEILEEAELIYQGDFLAGFTLRDSPAFDDWQFYLSEESRQQLSEILEALAKIYITDRQFSKAIQHTRRWITLDPLREEAHQQLMRCYASAGQRNAALQQYRDCLKILEKELGVSPLPETTKLYQEILNGEFGREQGKETVTNLKEEVEDLPSLSRLNEQFPITAPTQEQFIQGLSFPMVGRSRETQELISILNAQSPDGRLIILQGEPGIGKTRLAEEFIAYAKILGSHALSSRCFPDEINLAYAPIVELIRNDNLQPLTQRINRFPEQIVLELSRLIPELQTYLTDLKMYGAIEEGNLAQLRFYEALRYTLLEILKGNKPGIILIDDCQWADDSTISFISYLLRRTGGMPVIILLTLRDAEHSETLERFITNTHSKYSSTILRLNRLSSKDLVDLVRSLQKYELNLSHKSIDYLYQKSEGLPFFVIEYLQSMVFHNPDALKHDLVTIEFPKSVHELIAARLSGLNEVTQQILSTGAIIGRSFEFSLVQETSGRSELETLQALEKLIDLQLIEEVQVPAYATVFRYDFSHDQIREYVYTHTNLARKRILHRRIADSLRKRDHSEQSSVLITSTIAYHYQMAGLEQQAANFYKLAGDQAQQIYANIEAIQHYQNALAMNHPEKFYILEQIGDLKTLQGEYSNAEMIFQTAAALASKEDLARVEHKLGHVYQRQGKLDIAACYYQSSMGYYHENGIFSRQASILTDLSIICHQQNQTDIALKYAYEANQLAGSYGSVEALAKSNNILGMLMRTSGNYPEAMNYFSICLRIAEENDDPNQQIAAHNNLGLLYRQLQEYQPSIQHTEEALVLCEKLGDRHREAALLDHLAELHHLLGNDATSMEYLKQAVVIFSEIDHVIDQQYPEIWMLNEWL